MKIYVYVIAIVFASLFTSGCGENDVTTPSISTSKDSETCITCHTTAVSAVTGNIIADEWKASRHNTDVSGMTTGAGCRDCHEPEAGHPGNCGRCHGGTPSASNVTGLDVTANPDSSLKCFKCHHSKTLGPPHFNNITTGTYPASFVTSKSLGNCRFCHNPHNPTAVLQVNRDWGESGHGATHGEAWYHYDFKVRDNCNRCHTSTGFVNFATSNYTYPVPAWGAATDKTKEVLICKACHSDYNFKNSIRRTAKFTAPYNSNKNPVSYPDSGYSNLCIACHSGYESGGAINGFTGTVTALTGTIDGKSFINSHYLAAAALFYGKSAFHFYTSMTKYDTGYNTGKNFGNWNHGRLGMIDPATNAPFTTSAGVSTGKEGPCVTCHMGSVSGNSRTHTLKAQEVWKKNSACFGCHANFVSEGGVDAVIEEEKALFDRGMDFLQWSLANNNIGNRAPIYYDGNIYPYFHKSLPAARGVTDFKSWTQGTGNETVGKTMMGVAYDFNLIKKEKGAHVHNRTYTRRLIFDAIQYLQQGTNTYSTSTGSVGGKTDPNELVSFTAYSTAVSAGTRPANPTSITALKGWLLRQSGGNYYRR